jgi:hypothetical protein
MAQTRTYENIGTIDDHDLRLVNESGESFSRVYDGCCYIGSIARNSFGWEYRTAGQRNWYAHPQTLNADRGATIGAMLADYTDTH